MTQATFTFCDYRIPTQDRKRLAGQCGSLLDRLRQGSVTNRELIEAGMFKYTSRISDLRKAGYRIECERHDGGLSTYRLIESEHSVQKQSDCS